MRDRWSIECWHWIRDTQLHEDAHRYRGNGAGALASLRTAALNLLRLAGFQSIRAGMQAVMHDITALLAMVRRRPQPIQCQDFESALRLYPLEPIFLFQFSRQSHCADRLVPPDWFLPLCLAWFFTIHTDDPEYWCVTEALIPKINATPHPSC